MSDDATVVLGIPIPSTDPVFLGIVGVHVLFGLATVVAGAGAMLSKKGRGRHSLLGSIYFWCLLGVFATMSALSFMRWAANYHLFILGGLSFASAIFGRNMVWRRQGKRLDLHLICMSASYVLMLTAFYVDNGKNLPLWKELPGAAFWVLPSLVGVPIIVRVLRGHPLLQIAHRDPLADVSRK